MENMNNEIIETTEEVELMDLCEDELVESGEGNGIVGKVALGIVLAVGTGIGIAVAKNRDKIKAKLTERRIAKLEKEGFYVVTPDEMKAAEDEFVEDEVIVEADETEE